MNGIIITYIAITLVINFVWWIPTMDVSGKIGLRFCNPKWIYNHTKTNWFGTALLTILANVIFGPTALCYWAYKFIYFICTVGRKK